MKYRRKPGTVEADQWFPGKDMPGVFPGPPEGHGAYVMTIHGQQAFLKPGDFVVTEPDGVHHYPVKPDIFLARHDPAPAERVDLCPYCGHPVAPLAYHEGPQDCEDARRLRESEGEK